MPEDDRRETFVDVLELSAHDVRAGGGALEPHGIAAAAVQRIEQSAIASPDVEHAAGRRFAVQAPGQQASHAA